MSRIPSRAFRRHPSFRGRVPTSSQAQFQRVFPHLERGERASVEVRKPPVAGALTSTEFIEDSEVSQVETLPTEQESTNPPPESRLKTISVEESQENSQDSEPEEVRGFWSRLKQLIRIGLRRG